MAKNFDSLQILLAHKKLHMYRISFFTILINCGLLLTFSSSCKKKNDNCEISASNLVGIYIVTARSFQNTPSGPVVDDYSGLAPCIKDNLYTLKSDGTYSWSSGASSCSPPDDVPSPGTWSLSGNIFTTDGKQGKVISFDCKTLVLSFTDGIKTATATMVKQ